MSGPSNSGPLVCDECGQPVQVVCLIGDASSEAVRSILLAAHKRFHAEDRALAEAQREGARRMGEIGPITSATSPVRYLHDRGGRR